jgi:hypothetical protein
MAVSAFQRLARELGVKINVHSLKKGIPWGEVIVSHEKKGKAESYHTDLYLWSWKKGFVEFFGSEVKFNFKADLELYNVRYLLSSEIKKNPGISHFGIYQVITPLDDDNKKERMVFKMYQINKAELQD